MNSQPDNLSIYDANWSSWIDMKRYGPASRWLRELIGDALSDVRPHPSSIHDVGCGEGTTTRMLAQFYPDAQVRGSDFSATGIAVARRLLQPGLTFIHDSDNRALDQAADLVCCFEVLEHVDDWRAFLRRLTAGANRHLLLSFPTGRMRAFEVNVGHLRNFRKGEVEAELQNLGFTAARVSYAGFPFYSPLYRELCQLTNAGAAAVTQGSYGPIRRLVAAIFYLFFRFASTRRRFGDQFVGVFIREDH